MLRLMKTNQANTAKPAFLERFQNWAAVMGAGLFTFFTHPYAVKASSGFVTDFGEEHYGLGWAIPTLWWLITFGAMVVLASVILKVIFTGSVITAIRRFT